MKKFICIITLISLLLSVPTLFAAAANACGDFVTMNAGKEFLVLAGSAIPDWYPDNEKEFEKFHGENLPRIVDNADLFTPDQEARLTKMINELIEKHGRDFVIFTDTDTRGIDQKYKKGRYAADFYKYNGYGIGKRYSGSVLFICKGEEGKYWLTAANGNSKWYFTKRNIRKIDERIDSYMRSASYYEAMKTYISSVDELYEKGIIPVTAKEITVTVLIGLAVAVPLGFAVRFIEIRKMKNKVQYARFADRYVDKDSFRVKSGTITLISRDY